MSGRTASTSVMARPMDGAVASEHPGSGPHGARAPDFGADRLLPGGGAHVREIPRYRGQRASSMSSTSSGRLRDHRAGAEDRRGAGLAQEVVVLGRDDAADDDGDVLAADVFSAWISWGTRVL